MTETTTQPMVIIEYPEGKETETRPRLPEKVIEELKGDFIGRGCTVHVVPSTRFHISMTDFDKGIAYPIVYPPQNDRGY